MINEVTEAAVQGRTTVRKAYINCMSIKSSKDLYGSLLELLALDSDLSEEGAATALQKVFVPKKKNGDVHLVVLDEVDHILTLDLESLYRMFEWSMQKPSRLVLVGIANALDLTDRFLPRLKARNLKPELLPFLPYTAPQIKNIITKRLKSLAPEAADNLVPFFHPAAIELCSRKVSSQTGDLRKAFEILRRAIDLVEAETKQKLEDEAKETALQMTPSKKPLGENQNLASPRKESRRDASAIYLAAVKGLTVESAPRVGISHLNKVTSAAFSNGASQRLKTLNLQQKAALCALMALEKRNKAALSGPAAVTPSKGRVTAPTVKQLFDVYCVLCKRDAVLHPLSSSEFREVVGSLETLSLVSAVDGRTGSLAVLQSAGKRGRKATFATGDEKRVASCVGDREIESATEGFGSDILKSILSGEALD
jgi:cell division control protein 6